MMLVVASLMASGTPAVADTAVLIDAAGGGLPFDGHGGLSAGASSRLLYDYQPDVRDEILDYLFAPNFGAALHVCKVEIGGDTQSTDGTEPSHMHDRDDLDCTRGYEFWLMREARKRNPRVRLYALPWGQPGWVNAQSGYYGNETVRYQVNWLKCARDHHKLGDVEWLGLWNERLWGTVAYVRALRHALDAEGLTTQLVLVDGTLPKPADAFWTGLRQDADFGAAVAAVGLHYPCDGNYSARVVGAFGKRLWASEDWWSEAEWPGAACWAKLLNQNFIRMNMTSTIAWSTVWSVYPAVDTFEGKGDHISGDGYWGPGLMYAWQPWSGHYVVPPTVWATAHTTQFAQPGWRMPFAAAGNLARGGSHVGFVSPDGRDFSLVVETARAECAHCQYAPSTAANVTQRIELTLRLARRVGAVAVWRTSEAAPFVRLDDVPVSDSGRIALDVTPGAIYSITSTHGQRKGSARRPPPPSAAFPARYQDDFDGGVVEGTARFWADQCGSFQLMAMASPDAAAAEPPPPPSLSSRPRQAAQRPGLALTQRVTQRPGVNRWASNLAWPLTVAGDPTDSGDRTVQAAVWLGPPPPSPSTPTPLAPVGSWAAVCGRVSDARMGRAHTKGVCLRANVTHWRLVENLTVVGSGALPPGTPQAVTERAARHARTATRRWRTLRLSFDAAAGTVQPAVDDTPMGNFKVAARSGMAGLQSGWNVAAFDDFRWLPEPLP